MTKESFQAKVNSLDGCRIVYENGNGFILEGKGGGAQKPLYIIWLEEVESASWGDLRGVFLGERPPQVMTWQSRIVGYYSSIKRAGHNGWHWNMSKVAELEDRHRGNYEVLPEQPRTEKHAAAD
jgi:hypothetical protein